MEPFFIAALLCGYRSGCASPESLNEESPGCSLDLSFGGVGGAVNYRSSDSALFAFTQVIMHYLHLWFPV